MKLKELSTEQRQNVYNNYVVNDFHKSEVKPLKLIESLIDKGHYKCYGFYEYEQLLGYAYFVKTEENIFMDYLAVIPKYRCKGIGSKFISIIKEEFSEKFATLLAEVENPKYSLDEVDRFNRERRILFYLKNGFKTSDIETCVLEDQYSIIKLELCKELENEEIKEEVRDIYKTMFGEEFFKKNISVSKK